MSISAQPVSPLQLLTLLRVDQRARLQRGEPLAAEQYFAQYPALKSDPELAIDVIYSEILLHEELRGPAHWEQYVTRFPEYADQLRALMQVHRSIETSDQSGSGIRENSVFNPSVLGSAATGWKPILRDHPTVSGYQILRELGRGAMGVVYQARQLRPHRTVAIKMILAGELASDADVRRFHTEAEAAANLQHPHIVAIHEVGQCAGQHYFSMDHVEGQSLAELVRAGPLAPTRAARYLELVARAVDYAHERGTLHRDLKPANVLIDAADQPRITDFGLAKRFQPGSLAEGDTSANPSQHTMSGAVLGTPSYMPPEQAAGQAGKVGPASDVYGLGATLYELLTGRPPFQGHTPLETLMQVLNRDPPAPRLLSPQIPRDLETICLKCLEKESGRRYATARELADDLERFQIGAPIRARVVSSGERAWRWCRRNPALAATLGLSLVLLMSAVALAVGSTYTLRLQHEQQETTSALREARRQRAIASEQHELAQRMSTSLALERGTSLCEQGDPARGMLWFAHSLTIAPAAAADLQLAARTNLAGWRGEIHPLRFMIQHPGAVTAVAFSPDGRTGLTAGLEGTVQLWDANTGSPRGSPLLHEGVIYAVAFSHDSTFVATACGDKTARLWDVATGKLRVTFSEHRDRVVSIAISPNDQSIATTGFDSAARLWSAATGEPRQPPWHSDVRNGSLAVAFSPDGTAVLVGDHAGTGFLWDATSGSLLHKLVGHQEAICTLAFAADKRTLVTGSRDGTARLWDQVTGQAVGSPVRHPESVQAVAASPDGKTFATASVDGTSRVWKSDATESAGITLRHQSTVTAVAFSPDGRMVATASTDRTSRLWDAHSGVPLSAPLPHRDTVSTLAFHPSGKLLATGSEDGTVRVWELASRSSLATNFVHEKVVGSAAFSPDGKTILTTSWDKTARHWDAASGHPVGLRMRHDGRVLAAAFSPDGQTIVTGSFSAFALLWDARTGELLPFRLKHGHSVGAVAFSPEGRLIATGSEDGTARLWNATNGESIGPPLRHDDSVRAVSFSADSQTVLTGSKDGTARLWRTASSEPITPPLLHAGPISSAAFSPDGKWILTTSEDKTARIWQASTGKLHCPPSQHDGRVLTAAFSPNSQSFVTGCVDGIARLWSTDSGQPIGNPWQHQGAVLAVAYGPDGASVVTGSADGNARLWETESGRPMGIPLRHAAPVQTVTFSCDGKAVLTASADKTARLWRLPGVIEGTPERVVTWTQLLSGMERDADGALYVLDAPTWRERRQHLQELGGPPK